MSAAWFSDDAVYRYALLRAIDHGLLEPEHREHRVNFVMLNPSTATAHVDDPTIRRCIGFARRWGYGELIVTNLFAFRATDPHHLKIVSNPIGPENDGYIRKIASAAHLVVAAWGVHGAHRDRARQALAMLREIGVTPLCLGTTRGGHPKHPLYVPARLEPVIFESCTAVAP